MKWWCWKPVEGTGVMFSQAGMAFQTVYMRTMEPTILRNPVMRSFLNTAGNLISPFCLTGRVADGLSMIKGKFYSEAQRRDPVILKSFGFNEKEVTLLVQNPWWALESFYLQSYISKFKDPWQPFSAGLDDLDNISIAELYKRQGASNMALEYLGGNNASALYKVWRFSVMGFRGIPLSEGNTFRLKGGNQEMTNAFARKLGHKCQTGLPGTGH